MAGIGFSLKRLFNKKGILNLCKAYGYSGIVTIGPMLLGILLLVGMSFVARVAGLSDHDRELLNCMLTYSLLASLIITNWFNMVVTRYISDMIYAARNEKVMPSFFGAIAMELVICFVLYGLFLLFSGATFIQGILCLWFSMVLIVVWTQMIYMTALKDFQGIVLTFALSLMLGFLLALILVLAGLATLESLLACMVVSYGLLAVRQLKLMIDYFPKSEGSHFSFLAWFDKYPSLAVSGGMVGIGLFSHIVIMYFGPLRVRVEGLFYGAPEYDVPALIAFLSLLITTVSFVVSVEVNFYPKYSNYYGLFGDKGAIRDIKLAGKEMLLVLRRELIYLGCKQVFTTILFVVIGPVLIEHFIPGMSSLSVTIFRFLCVGYASYAIANSIMLIELYFEDYLGAMIGTIVFALVSSAMNIWQILYGNVNYYGTGFFAGAILFYIVVLARLDWYTDRLPYFLLSRQSLISDTGKGIFTAISKWLAGLLMVSMFINLTGCSTPSTELSNNGNIQNVSENIAGQVSSDTIYENETEVEPVGKKEETEGNITEDKAIYKDDDEGSVINMYLTVSKGNEADGSDHTWKEVNSYSVYDYEDMGVDRYKVEGILNIDETGEGLSEESFGYGETVPNVSVQIRGQTSSRSDQKNYKIRIKDGMGNFRGQRTLNINKHKNDPFRFLNKLSYDLLKPVPELIGGRTQFVHLYVKDNTEAGSIVSQNSLSLNSVSQNIADSEDYEDYGIYTMVEQVNRTFMRNHGMDENGQLYKVTFFEWDKYEEIMIPMDDPDYNEEDYNRYMEVKGDKDPTKLQEVIAKVNNYSIPIDDIIEEHFDATNLCYWMAFNIMTGNYDCGARNLFLYSPLNSRKFYMICWDMDASFRKSYNTWRERHDGESWETGMTKFLGLRLVRRMMKEEKYRVMLKDAVDDIYENYVNKETVSKQVDVYKSVVKPYLYREPDYTYSQMRTEDVYDEISENLKGEPDRNYEIFCNSLKVPWPFFVGVPAVFEDSDTMTLSWEASYDYNNSRITYDYLLATDPLFENVIDEGHKLTVPLAKTDILDPGTYFLKVTATNEEGYSMECFDYYEVEGYGKSYGCYCFIVESDKTIKPYK